MSFWGPSWHAPSKPAWWAGQQVLVRWQLERPMYDFKNYFPLIFATFIEQNIFFLGTHNALAISETDFTAWIFLLILQFHAFMEEHRWRNTEDWWLDTLRGKWWEYFPVIFLYLKSLVFLTTSRVWNNSNGKLTQGFLTVITLQIDATIGWSNLEIVSFWSIISSNTLHIVIKSWLWVF